MKLLGLKPEVSWSKILKRPQLIRAMSRTAIFFQAGSRYAGNGVVFGRECIKLIMGLLRKAIFRHPDPEHIRFAQCKLREGEGSYQRRDSSAFGLRMTAQIEFRNSLIMAAFLLGLFLAPTGQAGSEESPGLSSTNQQITVLYIDALNFYKEGRYLKAAEAIDAINDLLRSDLYVASVRRGLKIQPDEDTLKAFLSKMHAKAEELDKAKADYGKGYYGEALSLFNALQEESPQSKEIENYLEKIDSAKSKQRAKDELLAQPSYVYQQVQEKRAKIQAAQGTQKGKLENEQSLIISRELQAQEIVTQKDLQTERFLAKQEELDKFKSQQLQRITQVKEEQERQRQEQEVAYQKQQQEYDAQISEMKKSAAQEKALSEALLVKQGEDRKKVIKIEKLWREAKKLYEQEMYKEAIEKFQKVIELEGNPRIKYTPYALELIEKSKEKIVDKNQDNLSREAQRKEKELVNEVLQRQVPPYVEPPKRLEAAEGAPLIEPPPIRKKLKNTRVSLEFDKVDLKSVAQFLSKESGVNLVISQKVLDLGLKVNVRFTDTQMEEVIKYITKSLGLVYRIDKDVIWIAHPDEIANEALETRVYYLSKGGGLFTEFSAIGSGGTETSLGSSSASINKITTIEDTLKQVVAWPGDSKLTFDKRINALIVRNSPQNLQMLEDMLYTLDVEPYQILIEARFLEVDISDMRELGVDWKFDANFATEKTPAGKDKLVFNKNTGIDFANFTRAAEGLNLAYQGILTSPKFSAVLHALEETKKIKTLSSPRITTLNNQPAAIKVVDEWIYPTRYEYEIVQFDLNGDGDYNDAGETSYKNVPKDFQRRDVGILLKVVPSVGSDRRTINLSLIPEVSEATPDAFVYTGDVKLPKFTSRNLATTVVVQSGDTVVLGGLIKENRTKTTTKVPFLGDLPYIGALFKKEVDNVERKNLIIFVTAKILSASGEEVVVANTDR